MDKNDLQLISARETARILSVDVKTVYRLWRDGKLDFWCINGTTKTNRDAIMAFLERTRNEVAVEPPEE